MADRTIEILVKEGRAGGAWVTARHWAAFEPRRELDGATIGWATVEAEGTVLRFPAIVDGRARRVLTVRDWQAAEWIVRDGVDPIDLADPEEVAAMIATGSGTFLTPAGQETNAARAFARVPGPAPR